MKLYIDNLDFTRPQSFGEFVQGTVRVHRALNRPDECEFTLVSNAGQPPIPSSGARVELIRPDGSKLFTGYVSAEPSTAVLGDGDRGPWEAHIVRAVGEEWLLDRKLLSARPQFVDVRAGELLSELAAEQSEGTIETSSLPIGERLPVVSCGGTRRWSDIAQQVASQTRSAYRLHDREALLKPVGTTVYELNEAKGSLETSGLSLGAGGRIINDAVVLGDSEPAAYVFDEFQGDGFALSFPLSNFPFLRTPYTVLEEEFVESLSRATWESNGALVSGGHASVSPGTSLTLHQKLEGGGAWLLQHGELSIESGTGIVGGLFRESVNSANCVAGFQVGELNGAKNLQPFINAVTCGEKVTVRAGCRYALATRLYADETYRLRPTFRSSEDVFGGGELDSGARLVLECREIDPANPGSLVSPAVVLFDGQIEDCPAVLCYALFVSESLEATTNFMRIRRMPDVVVRTARGGEEFRSRTVGALSEGAECSISSSGTLYFYSLYPPEPGETIAVSYRTAARSAGRARDDESVSDHARMMDDGVRASVVSLEAPGANSSEDCALAARCWISDASRPGMSGSYQCSLEAFPGGDPFPGDALHVNSPPAELYLKAIIREVVIEVADLAAGFESLKIRFADEAAEPITLVLADEQEGREWPRVIVDASAPPALGAVSGARITALTSTTATIVTGIEPPMNGGFEVRRSDSGWCQEIDRNLIGRFTTQTFTLPRLARNQQYCIRQFDGSTPPRYSRRTTILYVDKPL